MEVDERVASLEEEFKLIKGELKQTLSSVREYLMETGLPDSEYSNILAAIASGGADTQKVEMKGDLAMPKKEPPPDDEEEIIEELEETPENEHAGSSGEDSGESEDSADSEEIGEDSEESAGTDEFEEAEAAGEEMASEEMSGEEMASEEMSGEEMASEEMSGEIEDELAEEEPMTAGLMEPHPAYGKTGRAIAQDTPRVNLLANLIRWVANAKREIGTEQLTTFLEVYGICGHLTPELKEVIIRLSDVAQVQSEEAGAADIWSRLLLELHGILTGADAPAHPVRPVWGDAKAIEAMNEAPAKPEVEEPRDESLQLKLVLTDSKGRDREFSLNPAPAPEGKKPPKTRK